MPCVFDGAAQDGRAGASAARVFKDIDSNPGLMHFEDSGVLLINPWEFLAEKSRVPRT